MRRSLLYSYYGLIIGTIFEIISFSLAHICQLIYGSSPVEKCRVFVIDFYLIASNLNLFSERMSYLISIGIIILLFAIVGLVIGYVKDKKNS